jgi:Lrp/AsnC family transcriptional regulator for asnA, asnC and gidA
MDMMKIDNIDIEIVNLLMEDGRMNAAEIARRIGNLSERAARYRVGRLVDEGIIQISAIPNPRSFGFSVVADVFIEVEPGMIMEVARKLAGHDLISYVAVSIGEQDISVQLLAHNNEEIYTFATGVIGRLPGVRKTTTSIVPVILKDIHKWRIPLNNLVEPSG